MASCYWHPELRLFLIIYVDDFKLSGPEKNLDEGWNRLKKTGIHLETPTPLGHVLGCTHKCFSAKLPDGISVRVMEYDVEDSLRNACDRYMRLAQEVGGGKIPLRHVATPFLSEDGKDATARKPLAPGPCIECPGCSMAVQITKDNKWDSSESLSKASDAARAAKMGISLGNQADAISETGVYKDICLKVLMQVLYPARVARFDLMKAVCQLACFATKWTVLEDRKLHRLMSYVHSTLDLRLYGWVGDDADVISPHLFADADFAGCALSQRCTSGAFVVLRGPRTSFPIACASKRQGCVSHSTPEAELVAMDHALRQLGLPSLPLWETLIPNFGRIHVHEDNQAMIRIASTGKNPTMRYLSRTHGVCVSWVHEQFTAPTSKLALAYELSASMCADIFTKGFTDALKWKAACSLINIGNAADLPSQIAADNAPPPSPRGGASVTQTEHSRALKKGQATAAPTISIDEIVKKATTGTQTIVRQLGRKQVTKFKEETLQNFLQATIDQVTGIKGQSGGYKCEFDSAIFIPKGKWNESTPLSIRRKTGSPVEPCGTGPPVGGAEPCVTGPPVGSADPRIIMCVLVDSDKDTKACGYALLFEFDEMPWKELGSLNQFEVALGIVSPTRVSIPTEGSSVLGAAAEPNRVNIPAKKRTGGDARGANIVQACCEPDNELARVKSEHSVIDITVDLDFTSDKGQRLALDNLNDRGDLLWFASPCTGGCPWNIGVNAKLGEETRAKLDAHWVLFRKLWGSFVKVAEIALERGCSVCIEWPKACAYWKQDRVERFIRKHGFTTTCFDGCAYGHVAASGPDAGTPIKKPWKLAYRNIDLGKHLCLKCPGGHDHVICRGRVARDSQSYPRQMAVLIHRAVSESMRGGIPMRAAPCRRFLRLEHSSPASLSPFRRHGVLGCFFRRWCSGWLRTG